MLSRRIDTAWETAQKFADDAAAVLARRVDVDRQVGQGAPEVDQREAVARAAVGEAAVVDLDLAVDDDVGRRGAQAGDLGVVADLDLQRLLGGAVGARLEQVRVAVGAHLVVDLRGVRRRRASPGSRLTGMLGSKTVTFGPRFAVPECSRGGCGGRSRRGGEGRHDEAEREGPADEPAAGAQPRGTPAAKRLGRHAVRPLCAERALSRSGRRGTVMDVRWACFYPLVLRCAIPARVGRGFRV